MGVNPGSCLSTANVHVYHLGVPKTSTSTLGGSSCSSNIFNQGTLFQLDVQQRFLLVRLAESPATLVVFVSISENWILDIFALCQKGCACICSVITRRVGLTKL